MSNVPRHTVRSVIYGPVESRRFGLSLGINLSGGGKHCSFNCRYCFRGESESGYSWSDFTAALPGPDEISGALEARLETGGGRDEGRRLDDITLAGNGEPTDNPLFAGISAAVRRTVDDWFDTADRPCLSLLSNGYGLTVPGKARENREAFAVFDRPCIKIDSAVESTWKQLMRPLRPVDYGKWTDAVVSVPGCYAQIMLVDGPEGAGYINSSRRELEALISFCTDWKTSGTLKGVYLVSMDKPGAQQGVYQISASRLADAASDFRSAGIPVEWPPKP